MEKDMIVREIINDILDDLFTKKEKVINNM